MNIQIAFQTSITSYIHNIYVHCSPLTLTVWLILSEKIMEPEIK